MKPYLFYDPRMPTSVISSFVLQCITQPQNEKKKKWFRRRFDKRRRKVQSHKKNIALFRLLLHVFIGLSPATVYHPFEPEKKDLNSRIKICFFLFDFFPLLQSKFNRHILGSFNRAKSVGDRTKKGTDRYFEIVSTLLMCDNEETDMVQANKTRRKNHSQYLLQKLTYDNSKDKKKKKTGENKDKLKREIEEKRKVYIFLWLIQYYFG